MPEPAAASEATLPEGLMEMEFKSRYRDLDNAAYGHVKREIETRIALCPIYRRVRASN